MACFVFAVLIFSGLIKIGDSSKTSNLEGKITIWGTLDKTKASAVINFINGGNNKLSVSYVEHSELTYEQSLIESFAKNTGPDLFFITPSMIQKYESFIYKIPYANFPEKTFRTTYIDGADVYLSPTGALAYPIMVDPMVMYYNKDIFLNKGIVSAPKYWNELFDLSSQLIEKKNDGTILSSMIALGRYDNVNNAKDILASLLIQNNNYIVERSGDKYFSTLNKNPMNLPSSPIESVLSFFIEFSSPSNTAYSWNRALPNSLDMFTSGKMAIYLGRASELFRIESINPNLSFDVAEILQTKGTNIRRTYGDIYALAVNKGAKNLTSAFGFAAIASQDENAKEFSTVFSLPPVLRSLLSNKPVDNPYLHTFFDSAIISRSWPDPDEVKSDAILKELIDNILSNKLSLTASISKANGQLEQILGK